MWIWVGLRSVFPPFSSARCFCVSGLNLAYFGSCWAPDLVTFSLNYLLACHHLVCLLSEGKRKRKIFRFHDPDFLFFLDFFVEKFCGFEYLWFNGHFEEEKITVWKSILGLSLSTFFERSQQKEKKLQVGMMKKAFSKIPRDEPEPLKNWHKEWDEEEEKEEPFLINISHFNIWVRSSLQAFRRQQPQKPCDPNTTSPTGMNASSQNMFAGFFTPHTSPK